VSLADYRGRWLVLVFLLTNTNLEGAIQAWALYAAKSSGRNCVRTLHDLSSETVA
jgi:hypothetical protein